MKSLVNIKYLRKIKNVFEAFGFDVVKFVSTIIYFPKYLADYYKFYYQSKKKSDNFNFGFFPILDDKFAQSGFIRGHYFTQDLFVAQQVFIENPLKHVDIGSRIDGFVAHLASFRIVEIIDIRTSVLNVSNINFVQLDFSKPLDEKYHNYSDSVSCLHTLEHFGLGRYGDEIDPNSYKKGLANLHLLCKEQGTLYLSVPIGENKIFFNAHRTFNLQYLLELINPLFTIKKLSVIDDDGNFIENISLDDKRIPNSFDCKYGCAIFQLVKWKM